MKKKYSWFGIFLLGSMILFACAKPTAKKIDSVDLLINNEDQLTQIIIYDVFTPPVASRIYVYSSIAAYEAIRHINNAPSISESKFNFSSSAE
jgi:hypothetical protein